MSKTTTTTPKFSHTKLREIMLGQKGKFMTVTFKKQNGTIRTINCKVAKSQEGAAELGYIRVWQPGKNGGFKTVDTRTVSEINAGLEVYKAR